MVAPRLPLVLSALFVGAALSGCLQTPAAEIEPATGALAFSTPVVVSPTSHSEPHIAIGPDGAIYVTAIAGLPTSSPLWKSTDNGATWTTLVPNPTDLGGGDSSIAVGPDGSLYFTDLWAGGSTIASSHDGGQTWTAFPISHQVPYNDREWNTVDLQGRAYYLGRTFTPGVATWVSRSDDGGKTWLHAGNPWTWADSNLGTQNGPLVTNPGNGRIGVAYTCTSAASADSICFSYSQDGGRFWTKSLAVAAAGDVRQIFTVAAADTAGNWYIGYAEREGDSTQVKYVHSPNGRYWSQPVQVTSGPGLRLFPWIVVGDEGRLAMSWYGSTATGDNNNAVAMRKAEWTTHVATTLDGRSAAPTFEVAQVGGLTHKGSLSTGGLTGGADRSLGDFFATAIDQQGYVHVAFNKAVGSVREVLHARQIGGPSLYVSGQAPVLEPHGPPSLVAGVNAPEI